MDEPRDPALETLLDLHRDVVKSDINVMLPGKIVSYDASKQTATVQPLVQIRHLDEDGETVIVENRPPIQGVPVEFLGPGRGRITWPVAAGDLCEIRFSSASLARWVQGSGGAVDPGDDRMHDLSDAVCQVGLATSSPPTDAPTDAIVLHVSGGVLIKLGDSSATLPVTRTTDVQAALVGALTDSGIAQAIYDYGVAPGLGKAAALAALVAAVNAYFSGNPVQGSSTVRAT